MGKWEGVFSVKKWKMGGVFCKKSKKIRGVFVQKWTFPQRRCIMYIVSVFFFILHCTYLGVRTHLTHPVLTGLFYMLILRALRLLLKPRSSAVRV